MTIGEQIKYIRKRRGLTQTQLAEMTGIHPVTIRKYEINKLQPKKEQIKRIAASLMVSPLVFEELDDGSNTFKVKSLLASFPLASLIVNLRLYFPTVFKS